MSRSTARRLAMDDQPLLPIGEAVAVVPITKPRRVPVRAHLRTVTNPSAHPPLTGAERRDAALKKHAEKEWTPGALTYVRAQLVALYRQRSVQSDGAYVTADDVEAVLREWPACPPEAQPAHGPQHWRGTVFRGKGWRQTGRTVPSTRPHMNATALPCWVPTDFTLNPTNP